MTDAQLYGGSDEENRAGWRACHNRERAIRNGFTIRRDRPGTVTIVVNPDPEPNPEPGNGKAKAA